MLRFSRLQVVVRELEEGLPSTKCLGETALHDMVYNECDEETMLFLVCAADVFISHKNAGSTPGSGTSLLFRF